MTARSEDDVIQGISHRDMPIYGVQFHPESIASENGHALLRNFIAMTGAKAAA
ncbi:MAG: gamma-glutamyl-gamma-aminobutyrate hydrolase family protein [Rhodospirillales bacterium]